MPGCPQASGSWVDTMSKCRDCTTAGQRESRLPTYLDLKSLALWNTGSFLNESWKWGLLGSHSVPEKNSTCKVNPWVVSWDFRYPTRDLCSTALVYSCRISQVPSQRVFILPKTLLSSVEAIDSFLPPLWKPSLLFFCCSPWNQRTSGLKSPPEKRGLQNP